MFQELGEVSAITTIFTRSGLTPAGETFKFKVAAVNAIGTGV